METRTNAPITRTANPLPDSMFPASPDWSQITQEVQCPLCDYNLRGIHEPRCPECGYRFEWPEILDPDRKKHPYLFEHHPERNLRSLVSTAFHGLLPRRFWSTLRPAQPSNPRRMLIYWAYCAAILPTLMTLIISGHGLFEVLFANSSGSSAGSSAFYGSTLADQVQESLEEAISAPPAGLQRTILLPSFNTLPPGSAVPGRVQPVQILNASLLPLHYLSPAVLSMLAWPWLTFVSLLVFRWSMKRARIKGVHVLRCCLYSYDLYWLLAVALSIGAFWIPIWRGEQFIFPVLVFLSSCGWKLRRAYRLYLRFDRPTATVFASQVVATLLLFTIWQFLEPTGLAGFFYGMYRMLLG